MYLYVSSWILARTETAGQYPGKGLEGGSECNGWTWHWNAGGEELVSSQGEQVTSHVRAERALV